MLKSIFHHASFAQVGEDKSVFITAGMLSYYWIQLEFTLPVYLICIGLKSQHHLETRNAVVAAGKKGNPAFFFQRPLPHFLHSRGQSVVILSKLEISPSLFNHHYGFQQP